jgi:hypothetical protein
MMLKQLLTLTLIGASLSLAAQKYSNEFLNIGVGAKGQALGGALVANANDVTGAVWNPASLANLENNKGIQLGAMHSNWYGGASSYDYFGIAAPLAGGRKTLGLSIIRFGVDNIPNTLSLFDGDGRPKYENVTQFSSADYAFLGTYAQSMQVGEGFFSIGGNAKVVRRIIGSFANSWGFGLDAGLQYSRGNFRTGIMIKDATNTFNSWSFSFTEKEKQVLSLTKNDIPIKSIENTAPSIIVGFGYKKNFGKVGVNGEIDANFTTDGRRNALLSGNPVSMNPAAGVEVSYDNIVFVRGGISKFQKDNTFAKKEFWTADPSLGVGLNIRSVRLDYAYTNIGSSEARSFSHTVSLMVTLKPKERGVK